MPRRTVSPDSTIGPGTPPTARHRLGPFDLMFLPAGPRVSTRIPMAVLSLEFDGEPPPDEQFAAQVAERARHMPALNVLQPTPGARFFPSGTWAFDTGVHVLHHRLPTPAETPALLAALLTQPLPEAPAPPWDLRLIRFDDAPRRFGLCYRIHHALQDGVGAAHTLLALTGDDQAAGPYPHQPARPTARGLLHAAAEWARATRPARSPAALPGPAKPSGRFTVDSREIPENRARELADRHGSTVNDVCLAALGLALGHTLHTPHRTLSAALPMSYRTATDRYTPGNHMLPGRLVLPTAARNLAEAVRLVHATTDPLRRHRAKDSRRAALALLPNRIGAAVLGTNTRPATIIASSLTFPLPPRVNGARMTGASGVFAPDESLAAFLAFTRACGRVRCTVVHDEATELPDALLDGWTNAFADSAL
ncbi:wax ester/triacylglycerol synthase domain-containing protein [Streptomyces tsukubensis]|uniref:wax ester/triacylglycerol synthase domain-containing protein n=1 Tax=Streptomyces tsukubensis TaxID=83656 RepID=UPI00344DDF71